MFVIIALLSTLAIYYFGEIHDKKINPEMLLTYLCYTNFSSSSVWETKSGIYYQDSNFKVKRIKNDFSDKEMIIDMKVDQFIADDNHVIYTYESSDCIRMDLFDNVTGKNKKIIEVYQWIEIAELYENYVFFRVDDYDESICDNTGLYVYDIKTNEARKLTDAHYTDNVLLENNTIYFCEHDEEAPAIMKVTLDDLEYAESIHMEDSISYMLGISACSKLTEDTSMESIQKLFPENIVDNCIYYDDGRGYIHQLKLDLSKDQRLFGGEKLNLEDWCIKDDYFYYTGINGLCKRRVDNKSSPIKVLSKNANDWGQIHVVNDWIFCCNVNVEEAKSCRINIDGGKYIALD